MTTPHGPGTVAEIITDWSHKVVEAGWEHDAGSVSPSLYVVDLDGDGGQVMLMAGDVTVREGG